MGGEARSVYVKSLSFVFDYGGWSLGWVWMIGKEPEPEQKDGLGANNGQPPTRELARALSNQKCHFKTA